MQARETDQPRPEQKSSRSTGLAVPTVAALSTGVRPNAAIVGGLWSCACGSDRVAPPWAG